MPPSGVGGGHVLDAQNGADLLYYHAKFGGAARGAKSLMFFCVFIVTLLKDRICEHHITMKELELRNKFGTVG